MARVCVMRFSPNLPCWHLFVILLGVMGIAADAEDHAQQSVDFTRDVQPLLAKHCLLCHGPDASQGGLRLDTKASAFAPLESGSRGVVPGQPAESEVLARASSHDPLLQMPPEGDRLTAAEIQTLTAWIEQGATWEVHWAYRPLQQVELPEEQPAGTAATAIDRLTVARLQSRGLEPSPEADRTTLIRRLSYDLVGLPPEPADVDAFLADTSGDAYERLVDRLLASPHFGERWGRHWLDKARYADSDGYEKDNNRPDAWRYRDWVIAAVNDDMPFDQFTIHQLAGDMLPDATPAEQLATAFHRQTLTNTEGGVDREQFRVAAVMDRTETLGTVWLGLSVGCARCHSHKYDQITQQEYYELYAFFNNADEVEVPFPTEVSPGAKAARSVSPDDPPSPETAPETVPVRVVQERIDNRRPTHILRRGEFKQPLAEVRSGTLTTLPPLQPRDGRREADRLDLARWLVNGHNPLVPRVAANHIWKHLFGEGLVPTMNDFGVRGDPPSHPALLDYLAGQLISSGWSRKALIKEVVMSATYRQSSQHRPELADIDPRNRLLHRQNRFRVEAEIIRDITLAASGLLSPKLGGPSVFPPIPTGVTELTYNSSFQWKTSEGDDRYRRGLYTYFKRTAPHPNLITFDCPDSTISTVSRDRSNTPIAALVTLNNATFVEAAQALAQLTLSQPALSDTQRVTFALRRCIARVPSDEELQDFVDLLETSRRFYHDHPEEAAQLVGTRPAANVDVEENAAWIAVVRIGLNLDEFLTRE